MEKRMREQEKREGGREGGGEVCADVHAWAT